MARVPVRIGQRYKDRYEVVAHIGEGAFAHVFRARELSSGRDVALKVLKEEYSDTRDVVERAVQLSHEKYCSATAMMAKTAELSYSIEVLEEPA